MSTKSTRSFCQKLVWQKNSGGSSGMFTIGLSYQMVLMQIRTDIILVLIWFQTVYMLITGQIINLQGELNYLTVYFPLSFSNRMIIRRVPEAFYRVRDPEGDWGYFSPYGASGEVLWQKMILWHL